jgi:hypothetical protein
MEREPRGRDGQRENQVDREDPFDVELPVDSPPKYERREQGSEEAGQEPVEQHSLEITPALGNGLRLRLALTVIPHHPAANSATPSRAVSWGRVESGGGSVMVGPDGKPIWGGYKKRAAEQFLADLDIFLDRHKNWGAIALLKAGGNDHRILARIRSGEGFRIDTLEAIAETMNKVERGELDPDEFRNLSRSEDSTESEGSQPSGSEGNADGKRKPRGRRPLQ